MNYDETPIRAFTAYTYDQAKAFQRFHARRYRLAGYLLFTVCGLAIISALYSYLRLPVRDTVQLFSFLPGIFMMLALAAVFYIFTQAGFYTQGQHARSMAGIQNGQTMIFREHDFLIAFSEEDLAQGAYIPYGNLFSVREADEAFYLYVNKHQALIVVKDGFQEGSPEALQGLFERELPGKYERSRSGKR